MGRTGSRTIAEDYRRGQHTVPQTVWFSECDVCLGTGSEDLPYPLSKHGTGASPGPQAGAASPTWHIPRGSS